MNEMRVQRRIAATAETVWDVLTDLERSPEVIGAIQSVERLDDGDDFAVGTRWRETRTMFGREATEEMEVTALDPGNGYVVEADGAGAHYRTEFTLEPDGGGTEVTMTFAAEPTGMAGRVMAATVGRLFAGATRKAVAADLDDIAHAAEQGLPRG